MPPQHILLQSHPRTQTGESNHPTTTTCLALATTIFALIPWFGYTNVTLAVTLTANCIFSGLLANQILLRSRNRTYQTVIIYTLTLYLLFAYAWTPTLSQLPAMASGNNEFALPPSLIEQTLPLGLAFLYGALAAILTISELARYVRPKLKGITTSTNLIITITAVSLTLKFVTQTYLDWGAPGLDPKKNIPLVTGLVVMHSRVGVHYLTTVLLLLAFCRRTSGATTAIVSMLVASNMALDALIGAKFSIVYSAASIVFCAIIAAMRYHTIKMASALSILLIASAGVIASYQAVHYYRFSRMSNPRGDITQNANTAIKHTNQRSPNLITSSATKIARRINGFHNSVQAIRHAKRIQPEMRHFWDSKDLTSRFTMTMTGVRHTNHSIGMTQCGFFSIVSNNNTFLVTLLSFAFHAALLLAVFKAIERSTSTEENAWVFGFCAALLLLNIEFAGGDLFFYAKHFFVIYLAVQFTEKQLLYSQSSSQHDLPLPQGY